MRLPADTFLGLIAAAAQALAAVIDTAPGAVRARTIADLDALVGAEVETDEIVGMTRALRPDAGLAVVRIILRRLPDYRANLLAQRFLSTAERETYVRQNVRQLRSEYPPECLWRMLARYLYEYQYLTFSQIDDRDEYFLRSTSFDADFMTTGILDRAAFRKLTSSVAEICGAFAVDEAKFNPVPQPNATDG
jgi:hypothetical protein